MEAQATSTDHRIVQGRLSAAEIDLAEIVQELQPFLESRTTSGFGDHGNTIYKIEFVDSPEPEWIVNGEDPRYGDAITLAHPMPPMLKRVKDKIFEEMQTNSAMLSDTFGAEFAADNGELGFLQVSIPLEFGEELSVGRLQATEAAGDVRETYGKHIDKPALFCGGANYIASVTVCGSACITIWRGKEDWTYPMEPLQWYAISKDIPHAVESAANRIALVYRPKVLAAVPPADGNTRANRKSSVARQGRQLGKKRTGEPASPVTTPPKRAARNAPSKQPRKAAKPRNATQPRRTKR